MRTTSDAVTCQVSVSQWKYELEWDVGHLFRFRLYNLSKIINHPLSSEQAWESVTVFKI